VEAALACTVLDEVDILRLAPSDPRGGLTGG
jgi:hypothetical protein